jgi:Ca2+-binding EF-hand superfamily protein
MLPLCLSNFNLGYANIWILWSSSSIVRLTDTSHIERELKDYDAMLCKNPGDKVLSQMVDKVKWRLREAQLAEEEHARDIPGEDMTYTKEFLALTSKELDKMMSVFRKSIDFDHDDRISVEDYCMFLRESLSMSPFVRKIFELSAPTNGKLSKHLASTNASIIDIGVALKATAVFCMLSNSDLLRFIYAGYDPKGYGVVDNKQFVEMLAQFHPRHRDEVVVQALKEIDLPVDGTLPFCKFESICLKFPYLLYPAFRIQEKVRILLLCAFRMYGHRSLF